MGLTIDLKPELEQQVRAIAEEVGVAPDQYVTNVLNEHVAHNRVVSPASETALLKRISLGIPTETWQRYHLLRERLENAVLTATEQQELKQITDRIEEANAKRIEALIQLANLRNTTLDALMNEFGLRPHPYVQ